MGIGGWGNPIGAGRSARARALAPLVLFALTQPACLRIYGTRSANDGPPLALTPAAVDLIVGDETDFAVSGGQAPYAVRLISGDGAVSAAGHYRAPSGAGQASVQATDAAGRSVVARIDVHAALTISPAAVTLNLGDLQTFAGAGGVGAYTYSVTGGDGAIDAATGAYTRPWSSAIAQVQVADRAGHTARSAIAQPATILQFGAGAGTTSATYGMTHDAAGNLYAIGTTTGTALGAQLMVHGAQDGFVAKYDPRGKLLWARQLGGGAGSTTYAYSVRLDQAGNIYAGGWTDGAGIGAQLPSGAYSTHSNLFIAKLAPDGSLVWARELGGGGSVVTFLSKLAVMPASGDVYFTGTTDSAGYATTTLAGAGTSHFIYVGRMDTDGNVAWIDEQGSNDFIQAFSIALDGAGNAYVCGYENRGVVGTELLQATPSTTAADGLLLKLDALGALVWERSASTNSLTVLNGITLDGNGDLLVTGYTAGTNFGAQLGVQGTNDFAVLKVTAGGSLVWHAQMGGGSGTYSQPNLGAIATDPEGGVYVAGLTSSQNLGVQIGTWSGGGADNDLAVFHLQGDGTLAWARQLGGGSGSSTVGLALTIDSAGGIFVFGQTTAPSIATQRGVAGTADLLMTKWNGYGDLQ